jgi:ATP-dependent RNA helicase DDX56/DBP9
MQNLTNPSARSKTGSGKTSAYVLPIIQCVLRRKSSSPTTQSTTALILVPTRELAGQVTKAVAAFTAFCAQDVRCENITRKEDDKVQRARLVDNPDIIVSTPGRAATHIKNSVLSVDQLAHIVIDEADLVLSYGYEEDLDVIAKAIPKGVQTFLMSATLRTELDQLKGLFCRDPVALELDEEDKDAGKLTQYVVKCTEDEKFLLIYAIFMLKLIKGKTIVFVGDIDRCYRLKLFLEQFGIKSCVLNSELPVNSRMHVVEEFNKGVYDIIIATDEHEILGDEDIQKKDKLESDQKVETEDGKDEAGQQGGEEKSRDESKPGSNERPKKRRKPTRNRKDKDYGVARGIDFQNVSCVLNFDLPTTSKSYTHRIGRTARGSNNGMALSFVIPADQHKKHKYTSIASTEHDEEVLAKITKSQQKKGNAIQPYSFDMAKLEGFRYRLTSALKAVTPGAIREARLRELKLELIKSEKLKRHFEENPDELRHLRHDGELRSAHVQPHLKHLPDYLLPGGTKQAASKDLGFVSRSKPTGSENRIKRARARNIARGKGKKVVGRKANPLQSFRAKR